ncbi:MAG: peptide/nickel transport system substrate-binding protein [Thermomicrobiales bacterium]|jgi:peptide/nickel transport system substrate-binding protein|nr:peptide/nickel transport system substrate-binding protein [Thermomicrobiales bacterium]MEA2526950.1 peptide/nickel transport system substrate-binding protein [Thermomicrobiales bacterium]MEA2596960.1 peptide/nickel transport system substrate-binding protein [Thermomicrobiales bacterium]
MQNPTLSHTIDAYPVRTSARQDALGVRPHCNRKGDEVKHDDRVKDLLEAAARGGLNRRELIKRGAALGVGVTALGTLTSAATAAPASSSRRTVTRGQEGGTILVGTSQEAVNYNPLLYANNGPETAPEVLMFDSLMKLLPDGTLSPNLAAEVPTVENGGISADGLTWTFKLVQNAKWHDGQPFTSADVKFTFDTVMTANGVRSRLGHDRVASLETSDEYTVVIKLKEPYAPFQLVWTQGTTAVIPKHILEGQDLLTAPFNTSAPVGTGPFKFVEHVGGDHLTVERNPDYHGTVAKVDRIVLQVIPETPTLFGRLKTGEVDVIDYQGIPPDQFEEGDHGDYVEFTYPSSYVEFIYFNNGKPWFQDKRVKQALYHGIDVDTIIDTIYYGTQPKTLTYLSPAHWAYNGEVTAYPFDLDKANALLDESGWVKGSDGIREKDGVKLAFTNSTTAGNVAREAAQQIIQQDWKKIGVEMEIKNMPAAVVWGNYTTNSEFDTLMVAWNDAISSDPDCTSRLHSKFIPREAGTGANYVQFKNAEADKLMEQGAAELDQAKRADIYKQLQALLAEELPWAPMFNNTNLFGRRSNIQGYVIHPLSDTNLWNANEWSKA